MRFLDPPSGHTALNRSNSLMSKPELNKKFDRIKRNGFPQHQGGRAGLQGAMHGTRPIGFDPVEFVFEFKVRSRLTIKRKRFKPSEGAGVLACRAPCRTLRASSTPPLARSARAYAAHRNRSP